MLGLPRRHFFDPQRVEKETLRAVEEAIRTLEEMGAKTRVVDLPSLQYENTAFVCIKESEVYANHEATVKRRHQDYGTDALRNIHAGAMYSAADYIQAQRIRRLVKQEFDRVLTEVDALVTPTMSYPAERFDQHDAADAMVRPYPSRPFTFTGHPAISVCCGFTSSGLPIGLQIADRSFDEATILRIAHNYERSTATPEPMTRALAAERHGHRPPPV